MTDARGYFARNSACVEDWSRNIGGWPSIGIDAVAVVGRGERRLLISSIAVKGMSRIGRVWLLDPIRGNGMDGLVPNIAHLSIGSFVGMNAIIKLVLQRERGVSIS